MTIARQSTARTIIVGPILDADGVAVTDAVVGDLLLSKNGGNGAALNGSATLTHRHTGHYSLALTTSDTDTVGSATVYVNDGTNAMRPADLTIVEEAVYDALYAASAVGPLLANSDGSGLTAINLPDQTMNITGNITGNLSGSVGSVTGNVGGTVATVTNLTNAPTNGDFTATMKTSIGTAVAASAVASVTGNVGGNVTGSVGSVTGLTAADVGAIKAKTDNLPSDPADQSLVIAATDALMAAIAALNNLSSAGAQSAAEAALAAYGAALEATAQAIKDKTDSLTFTTAGMVDAAIKRVGDTTLAAAGAGGQGYGAA